jgi:hypothetical protein
LAEKYDVEQNEAKKITIDRAEHSCISNLENKARMSGYATYYTQNKNTHIDEEGIEYVLLPVWMLNIKYDEKMYTFAMNGQTGKMIGDIPYSKKKAALFIIIIFVVIFGIAALITYLV